MRIATIFSAAATLLISAGSAFAVNSSVTMTSSMSPDALWKKIGDFCGIAAWHPAIEKCVLSADGKQRTLSIKGGGTVVEALESVDNGNRTYTYTILSRSSSGRQLPLDDQRFARPQGFVGEMGRQIRRQGGVRRRRQEGRSTASTKRV